MYTPNSTEATQLAAKQSTVILKAGHAFDFDGAGDGKSPLTYKVVLVSPCATAAVGD